MSGAAATAARAASGGTSHAGRFTGLARAASTTVRCATPARTAGYRATVRSAATGVTG
jgi:hypothetical protein